MNEEKLLSLLGQVNDDYIAEANPLLKSKKRHRWVKWCAMAASLCLIVSGIVFGYRVTEIYAMETSYISIDVNPSIELCLNRFDRVVDVIAYNEDGQSVVDCLDVNNKCYTDALEEILHNEVFCSYLDNDADLTFTIVSDREAEIRAGIEDCTRGEKHHGSICYSDNVTRQTAYENHCSVGKYAAYEELVQYDETVTIEDCRDMSMHEIHNKIDECKSHHGTSGNNSTNYEDNDMINGSETDSSETSSSESYNYEDSNQQKHHSEHHH